MILTPVIVAALLAAGFEPMPTGVDCPPGDIGGWWYDAKAPVATYVRYDDAGTAFAQICGGPQYVACALNGSQDDVQVGVITTRRPIETYSPAIKQHELCHLLGWKHGPWWL